MSWGYPEPPNDPRGCEAMKSYDIIYNEKDIEYLLNTSDDGEREERKKGGGEEKSVMHTGVLDAGTNDGGLKAISPKMAALSFEVSCGRC